ncbi:MAG: ABC transporter [Parcubacteria group bacterium Gr01-1014_29]|nr:MAG: ABC transporter [Parcubacteria group bacterium Gr01-1014_29]
MTQETKRNPLLFLTERMWHYSVGNRRMVVLYALFFVIANIIWSAEPLVVGFFLNELQMYDAASSNTGKIFLLLSFFLLLEITGWVFHGPARVMEMKNAFLVRANYKKYLLQGTMALPIEWHVDHHSGNTIDKIEKGTSALFGFSENTFQIIQAFTILIAGIGALLYYDSTAAAIVLVLSIPTFFILAIFDRKLVPGYKKVNTLENEISAKVFDVLSNITTVVILRIESLVFYSLNEAIQKPHGQFTTNSKVNEYKWFSAALLGRLAVVIVIGVYLAKQLTLGGVLVGTVYILYGYVDRIRGVFFQFAYLYNDIIRQRASVANAEELSKDFRDSINSKHNRLPKDWRSLKIEDLSFSYHTIDEADLHITDAEMEIKKGERIALIGESGGGKSTFLKLVRDLYHPKLLTLLVDGAKISKGFAAISNSISLVPQDPEIFTTTIRENITLGIDYPESHIQVFTDMAEFTEVIRRLPKGIESSIVEKGVNLSGGEKQRLALARGLLASEHKDIILLDEPTSSVDFGNELEIYKNIFESFPDKTLISSIHRLHLLSLFDSIYLFQGGRIIASGSFDDLKEHSPEFQTLWEQYIHTRDAAVN